MFELWKEFRFDCAHTLDAGPNGDPRYRRMHGHSYQAEVWLRGQPDSKGWIIDIGVLDHRLSIVRDELDHRLLNEIQSLGPPTMENLTRYIWNRLGDLNQLHKVIVRRDSAGEGCVYYGPSGIRTDGPLITVSGMEVEHA